MSTHIPDGALVVGVDGSPESNAATDWAVDEAIRRGLPLHLMHGVPQPAWAGDLADDGHARRPARCVQEALAAVSARHPTVSVTWSQTEQSPAEALRGASRSASLLVLGTRGRGAVREAVLGSTAVKLIADAHCPVVVLNSAFRGASGGPVVLGLGGDPADGDALEAAICAADDRNCDLLVVHASSYGLRQQEQLTRLTDDAHRQHPNVPIELHVLHGDPAGRLVSTGRQACLLVLGSGGRHEVTGAILGSVSQEVIRHAPCPVLIARTGTMQSAQRSHERKSSGSRV